MRLLRRKCKNCRVWFQTRRPLKRCCSKECRDKWFLTRYHAKHGRAYMTDYFKDKPWKRDEYNDRRNERREKEKTNG